jgi:hypothetical protein
MRIVGALFLALLAIGFFPFNLRILTTAPGLMLAAMSAALVFFAYRVLTHKKNEK